MEPIIAMFMFITFGVGLGAGGVFLAKRRVVNWKKVQVKTHNSELVFSITGLTEEQADLVVGRLTRRKENFPDINYNQEKKMLSYTASTGRNVKDVVEAFEKVLKKKSK